MSGGLDIGQIPDRPATPSTSSEMSQPDDEAKPRVTRDEDLADGETKPDAESNPEAKSPTAAGGTEDAPRKKNKKPAVDYVRPEISPNKVRSHIFKNIYTTHATFNSLPLWLLLEQAF
jgi:hypothetical protein